MATVVLLGTLDTRGAEYAFLADRLRDHGVDVILVDAGVLGRPSIGSDVTREEVAAVAGADLEALAAVGDRGAALGAMARGAEHIVRRLHEEGRLDAILALGGSGGTALGTQAMRSLPVGVPKLMVSTMASGDTRPYVGLMDVTMMHSVLDIVGLNVISERMLGNAAAAIAGMAKVARRGPGESKPLIAATMFGVTTPCVTVARERLQELGYEVLVFHANGTGGQSLEALARAGFLVGVLDVTTTELADDLVGGVLSAGPDRLEAAGAVGVPQVVSLGALDIVNFGPIESVPAEFKGRKLHVHSPVVTLMRTQPDECRELGRRIGRKLSAATGHVALFVPTKGFSSISIAGGPFHDPSADRALVEGLRETLAAKVELHTLDTDVNDREFARSMANRLHDLRSERVMPRTTA